MSKQKNLGNHKMAKSVYCIEVVFSTQMGNCELNDNKMEACGTSAVPGVGATLYYDNIRAFQSKLALWKMQLSINNPAHFFMHKRSLQHWKC